jgi:predicted permease
MRWTHGIRARLRLLFRGPAEARMEEELAFHLEMETEKNLRAGMSPAQARRQAVLAFGGVEGHKEALRDGRTFAWAGGLSLDLKLGIRMLRKYPGLTAVGGLAMAFAIWVGAGTFELLSQVLHPGLPLPESGRIVGIQNWDASASAARSPSPRDFEAWREELRTVADVGAFRSAQRNLLAPGSVTGPVAVAEMSAAGFRVAGVQPLLGRTLADADERPNAPPVAVLGHAVWQRRFGGDPDVVGRAVHLGNAVYTVAGVMPPGFGFPVAHELWIPLRRTTADAGTDPWPGVRVFGRLADGASLRQARAELAAAGTRAAADHPQTHANLRPRVEPYKQSISGITGLQSLGLLSVNVFMVMLLVVVCGNVALLIFARAATREGEIVVRNALGASRGRIVVQLFSEALVLAGVAAAVGLAAAGAGLRLAFRMLEQVSQGAPLPFWFHPGLSGRTVLYALALAGLGAVVAGVVPALKVTRGLGTGLRQATAGGGGFRFGGVWTGVIIIQVAVTVLFPVLAFFTQRDMASLRSLRAGFAEGEYLSARLEMDHEPAPGAAADSTDAARRSRYAALYGELERRLEADPAVAGVTFADALPRMYHRWHVAEVDGGGAAAPEPGAAGHRVSTASVDTEFFPVLRTPVLAGRGFHAGDAAPDARVVIVNQSFVDRVLGGRNPLGRRVRYVDGEEDAAGVGVDAPWHEIVGVVGDLGMDFGEKPTVAGVYHPVAPGGALPAYLAVQVRGGPQAFAPRLRAHAAAVDPALRLHDVVPVATLSNGEIRFLRTWFWLIVAVSALAILLALAGIYAVMAFTVAQRTREIGIRVALGADARRIVVAIFRRPLTQVAAGILAGGILTVCLPAFLGGHLTTAMAGVVGMTMVLMAAVCLLACIVPTRRALRVEPMDALRAE